jgi:hypothetical protein
MSPLPITDERVRAAGLAVVARLSASVGVLEGEAFMQEGYRAFLDAFDAQEALYGKDEAHRVMGEVITALSAAMKMVTAARDA